MISGNPRSIDTLFAPPPNDAMAYSQVGRGYGAAVRIGKILYHDEPAFVRSVAAMAYAAAPPP